MDEATIPSALSETANAEPPSGSAAVPRSVDPLAIALRSGTPLSIDEIVQLHQKARTPVVASSSGTKPTTVFTSPGQESSGTRLTSDGTSYNVDDYFGKRKASATYSSSMSATQGSSSDTEHEVIREATLLQIGGQFDEAHKLQTPRKSRCKRPQARKRVALHKKPLVVIHQGTPRQQDGSNSRRSVDSDGAMSSADEGEGDVGCEDEEEQQEQEQDEVAGPATEQATSTPGREQRYFRHRWSHRRSRIEVVSTPPSLAAIEEGRAREKSLAATNDSRRKMGDIKGARYWLLVAAIVAIFLTLVLSIVGAHFTGKHRMRCTKGLIYMATVLVAVFTMIAMVSAWRAVHEALLAGLFELVVGFALVFQVHEFMGPVVEAGVS